MSGHADTIRRALNRASSLAVTGTPTFAAYREAGAALDALVAENQRLRDALAEIALETIRASADPLAIKTMSRMHHAARAALDGPK